MSRLLMLTLLVASGACASGPSLESAISLHNTTRRIVLVADEALAPLYDAEQHAADAAHPDDEVAFKAAMAPMDEALKYLQAAKGLEQALHLAVEQWQQGQDDGGMTREVAACSAGVLQRLATAAAQLDSAVGPTLFAVVQTASFRLQQFADGAECPVTH